MPKENEMKSTKNNKKTDGKFHSKHVNHDPQSESARAKFGLRNSTQDNVNTSDRKES